MLCLKHAAYALIAAGGFLVVALSLAAKARVVCESGKAAKVLDALWCVSIAVLALGLGCGAVAVFVAG